ncbi:hypothetical protein C8F04DRAFT_936381 [Mycena alexandri]|uniref:Uncharacterized protein n=1 Tax=Mycena alexandri TaxID=1745969 RepID=A0AAD6XEU3_9AGAR|nr:hypothetical protein C8F04DRAFT_936381 [Mycena alexandri]
MARAAPFSRLQLAAALLEYDNDPSNPDAPYRSANESAIFANFRRAQSRAQLAARKSDYLGVALPSETGSLGGRESALSGRRSRGSLNILRNPFGADESGDYEDEEGDEEEEEELEVDLSSWGLDAFIPKEKESKAAKRRSRTATLPNPHPVLSVRGPQTYDGDAPPRRTARSMSVGNLDHLTSNIEENRRKSFGSPLDLEQVEAVSFQRNRATSQPLPPPSPPQHQSVPFPTGSVRSPSPQPRQDDFRSSVFTSRFDPKFERQYSSGSMDPRSVLRDEDDEDAGPRRRTMSNNSTNLLVDDNNPFALRPPSTMSRFDPKAAAHARTMSNASMGSRMMLDDASVMTGQGRDRHYSTLELLRPKILVMPSPLQSTSGPVAPTPSSQTRDGFLSSADPPLPPGARSARRSSSSFAVMDPSSAPAASNLFTPNPRMNLTLSQLTFRNTLLVGGQRDVTYADIDGDIPRANEDGVQVQQTIPETEVEEDPQLVGPSEDQSKPNRPPGKLFGKSLIDDLESRKASMRTKQRVFTGDSRPSMMARPQAQRQSTLIDPALLPAPLTQGRPLTQNLGSFDSHGSQQALGRKPLLNFDDDNKLLRPSPGGRIPSNNRSVFGVDTLWERELVKLKEIEAQEKIEQDLQKAKEAEEEGRESKKRGRKAKGKDKSKVRDSSPAIAVIPDAMSTSDSVPIDSRIASSPPVLPAIPQALRRPPPVNDDSDSDDSDRAGPSHPQDRAPDGWVSSDDEGDGPTRTTGTGPRFVKKASRPMEDEDSEEDLPLAATIDRAAQRATQLQISAPDSDEEQPLSVLLQKTKMSLPSINFDRRSRSNEAPDDEEDDDQPLGLRASRIAPSFSSVHGGEDDDMPLAYHPEQQRRSQYHMMAAQVQQQQQIAQQQMMMQAQMQFFSPQPMMAPGYFGPPMMMQPPMAPAHDEAKYGLVDRWRRDVVIEDA